MTHSHWDISLFLKSCEFRPPECYQNITLWRLLLISDTRWDHISWLLMIYHWPLSLSLWVSPCVACGHPCSPQSPPSVLWTPMVLGWQKVFFILFILCQCHQLAAETTAHVWWSYSVCVYFLPKYLRPFFFFFYSSNLSPLSNMVRLHCPSLVFNHIEQKMDIPLADSSSHSAHGPQPSPF